ncbi:MAG: hypothetical protein M3153_01000 [Chloroflexota bacterium]|nr:hypothetical protein [Chloroflexota bacterium]
MPSPAELLGRVVRFVGDILGASSLRFDVGPTLVTLGVILVLLQLVARPISRWVTADAAGLAGVGRAMALAAESGTDAVVSLGGAGITRATDALGRLQTLAALPLLGHVARAAARSGVPLRVLTNDALAGVVATATVDAAHAATATQERQGRSRVVMVGEGRPAIAGLALTTRARPAAAFAVGSLREEALLHLDGLRGGAGSLAAASAEAAQAPSLLIGGGVALIGPQPFQAGADLRSSIDERTMVTAANRLIGLVIVLIVIGSLLALAGAPEVIDFLAGNGRG